MSEYKFNNGFIYRKDFKLPMTRVVEILNEMYDQLNKGDEKWTHDFYGRKCRILIAEPDAEEDIVVLLDNGKYCLAGLDDLETIKPVKPKLTKDKFADFVIEKLNKGIHPDALCNLLKTKLDAHEIIEGQIEKKLGVLDEVESVYMQAAETPEPISFREAFDAVEEQLLKEQDHEKTKS